VQGAFNIGAMIGGSIQRQLGWRPSGAIPPTSGRILAVADYLSRKAHAEGKKPLTVRDVLTGMIKAHEIQGVTAIENSYNASASIMCCWCESPRRPS